MGMGMVQSRPVNSNDASNKQGAKRQKEQQNQQQSKRQKKNQNLQQNDLHSGGVIAAFKGFPEGFAWQDIKEQLKEKLPDGVKVLFANTDAMDAHCCLVVCSPFEEQMSFFEHVSIDVEGLAIPAEVCYGDELARVLESLPKHIQDKRQNAARNAAKSQKAKRQRIQVGPDKYASVSDLRGHVKEIMRSTKDGDELGEPRLSTMRAVLEHHPSGPSKSEGLVGIKVDKALLGCSRTFFMIFASGEVDDFSAKKCLDNMEANPLYV